MDKISVIIPVYNAKPHLEICLESVLNQKHNNLEVLLINDGSTDGSGVICNEYARRDKRIRTFHKENGGVSSSRNVGLKNITGKYVGFIDSDDWAEPDMFEILYNKSHNKNNLISVCGYSKDSDTESVFTTGKSSIPKGVISTKNMILYMLNRDYYIGFCGYLWNKLFPSGAVKRLTFDEEINYGEDVLFYTSVVLKNGCKGLYTDIPLYHYRQGRSSISKSESSEKKLDILKAYKKVEGLLVKHGYSDIAYWARGFYCYHASMIAELALKNDDNETFKAMQTEIKENLSDYTKTNKEFPEKFERMYRLIER